jgi:hypothetical protein
MVMDIFIPDIRVYDPRLGEVDLKNYRKIKDYLSRYYNRNTPSIFESGLTEKVLDSNIEKGITLRDFLFGEEGYFKKDPRKKILIFIDGVFHSMSDLDDVEEKIDKLAETKNSIPFAFSHVSGSSNIYFIKDSK